MKIAIIGYGKMGKVIERLAQDKGHSIVLRATSKAPVLPSHLKGADVAIEFSEPNSAVSNILACIEANVPIVVGTTGWYNRVPEVEAAVNASKSAVMYASNFSIGVNVFNQILNEATEKLARFDEYTPSVSETHHVHKKDAPSGTAITLAESMLDHYPKLSKWNDQAEEDSLHIESIREDEVNGTHVVRFSSSIDTIELTHIAHSREGFAAGSIKAAEWLQNKTGLYTMRDLLNALLK